LTSPGTGKNAGEGPLVAYTIAIPPLTCKV